DVDLPASGRAEGRAGDQLAHRLDAVVGGRVELVHVERRARRDLHAGIAGATRLAVLRRGAVERLGEDAGRRVLARAARTADEVGMGDAPVADGVTERPRGVVLAAHVGETLRPVATVERLIGYRRR